MRFLILYSDMDINAGVRRIRKVNYTHMISLPRVWLESVGARAGDRVQLEISEDGCLVVRFTGRREP